MYSSISSLLVIFCIIAVAVAFGPSRPHSGLSTSAVFARLKKQNDGNAVPAAPTYTVGENVPEEVLRQQSIYDMVLVERYIQPEKTDFGLFLPKVEGKDEKHLGKVISIPSDYGLEGEQGRVAPVEEIIPYKVGDVVYIRDPWGVGPKDQEYGARCFSFHKAAQITGVVTKA
jgi:co-chaperonin GroES (HSP10)